MLGKLAQWLPQKSQAASIRRSPVRKIPPAKRNKRSFPTFPASTLNWVWPAYAGTPDCIKSSSPTSWPIRPETSRHSSRHRPQAHMKMPGLPPISSRGSPEPGHAGSFQHSRGNRTALLQNPDAALPLAQQFESEMSSLRKVIPSDEGKQTDSANDQHCTPEKMEALRPEMERLADLLREHDVRARSYFQELQPKLQQISANVRSRSLFFWINSTLPALSTTSTFSDEEHETE